MMISESKYETNPIPTKNLNVSLRLLSQCLLNIDRYKASTTSPESLIQHRTILLVRYFLLKSIINIP